MELNETMMPCASLTQLFLAPDNLAFSTVCWSGALWALWAQWVGLEHSSPGIRDHGCSTRQRNWSRLARNIWSSKCFKSLCPLWLPKMRQPVEWVGKRTQKQNMSGKPSSDMASRDANTQNSMCLWARSSSAEGICDCSECWASEKQLCQRWMAMRLRIVFLRMWAPHTVTVRCRDVLGITSHTSSGAQVSKRPRSRVWVPWPNFKDEKDSQRQI